MKNILSISMNNDQLTDLIAYAFNAGRVVGRKDGEAIKALVERGLMDNYAKGYYRATERGAILAGVHPDEAGFVARGGR